MSSPLDRRGYPPLLAAQVTALVGTGLLTVSLGLLAEDFAGSAAGSVLGTALLVKMLAYVIASPVMAAATRRLPRTSVLVMADVIRCLTAAALPLVTEVWQVYVLIGLLQTASATFTPTFQSALPDVLPDDDEYARALSFSRVAYDLENVLSPLLAALLLTRLAYSDLFSLTSAGFAASAALVLMARLPRRSVIDAAAHSPRGPRALLHALTRGIRTYLARPRLRSVLALNVTVSASTALVLVNSVVYARDLPGGEGLLPLLLGAFGFGSVAAALALPRLLRSFSVRRTVLVAGIATTIGLALATFVTLWINAAHPGTGAMIAICLAWGLLGAAGAGVDVPLGAVIRNESSPEDRSELFAAQFSLSHACYILSYPLAGWIGAAAGLAWAAAALTAVALAGATTAAILWPGRGTQATTSSY